STASNSASLRDSAPRAAILSVIVFIGEISGGKSGIHRAVCGKVIGHKTGPHIVSIRPAQAIDRLREFRASASRWARVVPAYVHQLRASAAGTPAPGAGHPASGFYQLPAAAASATGAPSCGTWNPEVRNPGRSAPMPLASAAGYNPKL